MLTIAHVVALVGLTVRTILIWRPHDDRVIRVRLDMFLEILRTLEGLPTELALVRLQRDMDANV